MVWMSNKDFVSEHKHLVKVLTSGPKSAQKKEAAAQKRELQHQRTVKALNASTVAETVEANKEYEDKSKQSQEPTMAGKSKHNIRNVHIEPADDGGFMVEIRKKATPKKDGKGMPMPMYGDEDVEKRIAGNVDGVHDILKECFSGPKSRSKKGKESSSESGSSRVDTYEAGEGDDEY